MSAALYVAAGAACAAGMHLHAMFEVRHPILGRCTCRLPGRRGVALTFDDGPDPELTPRILDRLDAAGVRGTFFLVGRAVLEHPATARLIVERGHTIANHTHRHPYFGVVRGTRFWHDEIETARVAIRDTTGRDPAWFRPPLGHRTIRQMRVAKRDRGAVIGWSRRTLDALATEPESIVRRAAGRPPRGDIVLLHDGRDPRHERPDPTVTERALVMMLARWREQGVPVVDLPDVLHVPPYRNGPAPAAAPRSRDDAAAAPPVTEAASA